MKINAFTRRISIWPTPTVFNMFSYDFIEGDPGSALDRPNTIVISSAIAKKYFDTESALGKTLQYENGDLLEVTGVIKNVRKNSHFSFDGLVSRSTKPQPPGKLG